MIGFIKANKRIILYLIFGVATTIINIVSYWFLAHVLNISTMSSTVIAWFLTVFVAYVTNRKWVFDSQANKTAEIIKECFNFYMCRVATGVLDWLCMFIFVEKLKFNDVIIKFVANVIVVILNYIASKILIFRRKDERKN